MNKLTIIGNLTRDPELRSVNTMNGPVNVCTFTVAVNNRRGGRNNNADGQQQQNDADFFRVTAWRALGENCSRFLAKGRKVCVIGPVSGRIYQAADGTSRLSMEVTADDVEFLSSRNDDGSAAGSYNAAPAAPAAPTVQNNGFTQVDNDELPF